MGLRERYMRRRLAKLYRKNAGQCSDMIVAQLPGPITMDARGMNVSVYRHPYLTPKLLASQRDRWLAAAEQAEAGRWDEARAIAASVEAEMEKIMAQVANEERRSPGQTDR
jgi:hypothetical protein